MEYLIRKPVVGRQDELQDVEFEGKALSVGGELSQSLHLPGLAAKFMVIEATGGGNAKFKCIGKNSVTRDDTSQTKGVLQAGDVLVAGPYKITIISAPAGFDFALQIQVLDIDATSAKPAFAMSLEEAGLHKRRWALLTFTVVLLAFLIVPLAGMFNTDLADKVRKLPGVPSDNSWSSGPLLPAHRIPAIGDDCNVCHVKPFQMVQDEQCLSCHSKLTDHLDLSVHKVHDFADFRCGDCHREHNEPAQLVRTDDALCVDCHKEVDRFDVASEPPVEKVSGFNTEDHPEFRLSLLQPKGPGGSLGWETQRPVRDSAQKENSGLKFPHDLHLDDEKVQESLSGEGLTCSSCHTLKDDGEHFEPITMDKSCQSCHKLTYDSFEPDLELPHGDLRAAIVAMEAHFIRQFTDPALRASRSGKKPRRVPGKREAAASCQGTGLDCGRAEAAKEAQHQFTKIGCVTCHEVDETESSNVMDRFYVRPIMVNDDWFQKAKYDHASHLTLVQGSEQQICESCHAVSGSSEASDISIPARDGCVSCHADDAEDGVPLNCIGCHDYHYPDGSVMNEVKNVQ